MATPLADAPTTDQRETSTAFDHHRRRNIQIEKSATTKSMSLLRSAADLSATTSSLLSRIIDYSEDDSRISISHDYVSGVTLTQWMRETQPNVRESLHVFEQVYAGLAHIHALGILHQSLIPENVFVDGDRVTLITPPVAFAASKLASNDLRDAHYNSPEQSGTLAEEPRENADLYSAAVMLFECITGSLPFQGGTLGDALLAHVTSPIPFAVARDGSPVCSQIDVLLRRLLNEQPRDRYQTAKAVVHDIRQLSRLENTTPTFSIGCTDSRSEITDSVFISREEILEQLFNRIEKLYGGQSPFVSLAGVTGVGKSRVLSEFARRLDASKCWVVRCDVESGNGQASPLRAFNGLIHEVVQRGKRDRIFTERIADCLVDSRSEIAAAIPQLRELLGVATDVDSNQTEPIRSEFKLATELHAVSQLIRCLGTADSPLVLLIDNIAESESALSVVRRLASLRNRSGEHSNLSNTLIVATGTAKSDEELTISADEESDLQIWLEPISNDAISNMLKSMAGELPTDAVEFIVDCSEGNPLQASLVLRGLVETNALFRNDHSWEFKPDKEEARGTAEFASQLLAKRIEKLETATTELLTIAALLGHEFDLSIAGEIAGLRPAAITKARDAALGCKLLKPTNTQRLYSFFHDSFKRILLERLGLDRKHELHHKIAAYFNGLPIFDHQSLAIHLSESGDLDSALPHALKAAERALASHALPVAEQQFRIAHKASSPGTFERFQAAKGLGETLLLLGHYVEAEPALQEATELADTRVERSRMLGCLAKLWHKRNMHPDNALAFPANVSPQ